MPTPTIPQFTRDLFPTDGCQVGAMKLSDSQRSLINKVVSGENIREPRTRRDHRCTKLFD